jgi:integrase
VLADAGMLDEDRQPAIVRWFPAAISSLPEPMQQELSVWFEWMRLGSAVAPRRLPRSDSTINTQLRYALPVLQGWARTSQSLREIGRDDVLAALPPSGAQRMLMLQRLRSIFKVLKGRKLVFVNPTAWIRQPSPDKPVPPPVDLAALRQPLDSPDPAAALLTALLAFPAVRIYQICRIRLTDLRDGRLHVDDQVIPLAGPVRKRVGAWLDYRSRTWPYSVNPYLFLHVRNAGTQRPVSPWWIRHQLPIAEQRIRQDRILSEADATSGDIRALCGLFGISIASAYRYSANAAIDTSCGPAPGHADR